VNQHGAHQPEKEAGYRPDGREVVVLEVRAWGDVVEKKLSMSCRKQNDRIETRDAMSAPAGMNMPATRANRKVNRSVI